jgi:hypothetical protein
VREELLRLNTAAEAWRPGESEPAWAAKVVPRARPYQLGLCNFTDLNGPKQLFSLYVRFQPAPERIHFQLITEEVRIRVGYVGRRRLATWCRAKHVEALPPRNCHRHPRRFTDPYLP